MSSESLVADGPAAPSPVAAGGFTLSARPESPAMLLRRLWGSRELIAVLARREFFVRFKRASLGVLWAVGVPALQAGVMVVVFSRIVRVDTAVPYITFVFAGMTVWSFFASALATASTAIVDGLGLASKIYFPRAVLPLVSVGASVYGLGISLGILAVVELADTRHIGAEILLVIPAAGLLVALAAGFGLLNSALHVYLRDVRFLVQAALLVWIYVTPVFYPVNLVHGSLRGLILANPLTGIVEVFRAATVGADTAVLPAVAISAAWSVGLIVAGLLVQSRFDRLFTDLL